MTSRPQSKTPIKPASRLPVSDVSWLAPLLDTDGMAEALVDLAHHEAPSIESCAIKHVRYRPGTSCTILYEVHLSTPEGSEPISIYARRTAPGRMPATTAGLSSETGSVDIGRLLDGPTPMEPEGAVLREFPLDAMIANLVNLQDQESLARDLVINLNPPKARPTGITGSLVRLRYKPEHRLVLRADLAWWDPEQLARVERIFQVRFEYGVDLARRSALIFRLSTAIPKSGLLTAPGPEIYLAKPGCSVITWREGKDLAAKVRHGDLEASAAAGQALAALGRLEVPGLVRRDFAAAVDSSRAQVEMLRDHPPHPGLFARFTAILDHLPHFEYDGSFGLVHGDFHQGQLLRCDDRICVLDWDRSHYGDQACDFGRFLAQIELLDLRGKIDGEPMAGAFRDAFFEEGGTAFDSDRECSWTVLALVDLALREIRRLRPDWLERMGMILNRCERILNRRQGS